MVGLLVVGFINGRNRQAAAQEPQTGDIVTVTKGDLSASATASGTLVAQRDADAETPDGMPDQYQLTDKGQRIDGRFLYEEARFSSHTHIFCACRTCRATHREECPRSKGYRSAERKSSALLQFSPLLPSEQD